MTHEESKIMWKMEKENTAFESLSSGMKELYNTVDGLIEKDIITYDVFIQDLVSAMVEVTEENKSDTMEQRKENINLVCLSLIDKYNSLTKENNDKSINE